MKLYRTSTGYLIEENSRFYRGGVESWDSLLSRDDLHAFLQSSLETLEATSEPAPGDLLAPIDSQEVWAAGVTYYRSRDARMEESKSAGGGDFYDRVYSADRPELFFKAVGHRVGGAAGQGGVCGD